MAENKNLNKVIAVSRLVFFLYAGFRIFISMDFFFTKNYLISITTSAFVACLFLYLCWNIWATKGMIAMSLLLSSFVVDVILVIILLLNILLNHIFNFSFEMQYIWFFWVSGLIALFLFTLLMIYGYINEQNFVHNKISVPSKRIKSECKISIISDIHFGTIQKANVLVDALKEIDEEKSDYLIFLGDICEEHTSHKSFKELSSILSRIKIKHNIVFVHGNHDRQEKLSAHNRSYTDIEFDKMLENNNIKCIDDIILNTNMGICLYGRDDYSNNKRKSVSQISSSIDRSQYNIVIEHQPTDIEELCAAGFDLCLAAHYHGAQNWPNNIIYKLAGIFYNGMYNDFNMKIYVTAGITGSKYIVRTHGHCEILTITFLPNKC